MILTAHQPAYLPWLGLFHKIALADHFIYFDQVQYVPKDWISRNYIKGANGPILLTVPVLTKGYLEKTIAQIEINNNEAWAKKHWKTILLNYKKAPHFKEYADFFEEVYNREWKYLADLNYHMLCWLTSTLGIKTKIEKMGKYDFQGKKSALVLDMCVKLKAKIYIFGSLGKDYVDMEAFKKEGVMPYFQSYAHPKYAQLHGDFIPNMSAIDLLFNIGIESLKTLMSGNISKDDLAKMNLSEITK